MYLVYAPNVRAGGGLVLLQTLLAAWHGNPHIRAVLDMRAQEVLSLPAGVSVDWTPPGLLQRLRAEWRLRTAVRGGANVVCFHGLPPLFVSKSARSRITVFLQNRLVIERGSLSAYPLKTRVRLVLERRVFLSRIRSVGDVIVQSPSMKRTLHSLTGDGAKCPRIHVRPLVPNDLKTIAAAKGQVFDFIYPATGEAHKNHSRLIEAWELLKREGCAPSLAVTLGPRDQELWARLKARVERSNLAVTNLGVVPRHLMGSLYGSAGALIVPSTTESFSLPLAEAAHFELPIIAAELDYVRDVCQPVQTFDPNSAISIARAVKRYLRLDKGQIQFEAPEAFWDALTVDRSNP